MSSYTQYTTTSPTAPSVLTTYGLARSDVAYKYYTKRYGKNRIRIWNSTTAAADDARNMRKQGYRTTLTPDKKSVIILGKTTRGYAKTRTGSRAMKSSTMRQPGKTPLPRKKPYTPSGHSTFRQPSLTLRKMGWSR